MFKINFQGIYNFQINFKELQIIHFRISNENLKLLSKVIEFKLIFNEIQMIFSNLNRN